jgi:ABC-type multidrug transport system fused ATPase/permease subunit
VEEKEKNKIIKFLDNLDDKFEKKGKVYKNLWQLFKFGFVSFIITVIQLALLYLMYYLMKGWTDPLPGILAVIFSPETVGEDHANWGYMLPFFLSNFIANTVGYFLNKSRTFKSDAPIWHYLVYIVVLIILIMFSTWFQGVLMNVFIVWGVEIIGPFIAMNLAGFVQFLVLYPLQKFVLLRERKVEQVESVNDDQESK